MTTGKITKSAVEAIALPAIGKRAHLWDATLKGFGVMVTDRGVRSYLVQYRIGGRESPTRRVTIGKHGSPWTAETARTRASELLEQVRRKVDPFDAAKASVEALRKEREAKAASTAIAERLGFATFASRFVDKYAKVEQPRSWRETDGIIKRDLTPEFGDKPLTEITDADVVELIEKVGERSPSAALKAYKTLRLIFGYASDKERRHLPPTASPMLGIKPPSKAGKRDRVLSADELRLAWKAAGGLGYPFGAIVRLLILTGQRRDEVAGLNWPELNLTKKQWLLPADRSKNKIPHLVPLSEPVLSIIGEVPIIKNDAGLLFSTTGETAVSGFSKAKSRLDALMLAILRQEAIDTGATEADAKLLSIPPWTLHDLRRTAATGCQALGVTTEVVEAVLNHASGTKAGVAGVYQVHKYEREKRAALTAWGRHVMKITTGSVAASNVIVLERRA